ncbi:MAG: hypothetical protein H0W02_21310 [Ktedonobacteraceae bacterium]|nr:hypothetical protein [Ktedonobacteraceae bacterium]
MQQAYRALRVVAEEQTIRIVVSPNPTKLMLTELSTACASLGAEGSSGIKAIVLDFSAETSLNVEDRAQLQAEIERAYAAVRAVAEPVLAIVRTTPSPAASTLIQAADLTLVAHDAMLLIPGQHGTEGGTLPGVQAAHMGYVTWSVPAREVNAEMRRVLDMLRGKSAAALRNVKASIRLGTEAIAQADPTHTGLRDNASARLEALKRVNSLYLTEVMQTADAHEGLRAFLEKRDPEWKNQ